MKKIIALLAAAVLVSALMTAFALAKDGLTATAYTVAEDNQYVYVLFSEPVTLGSDVTVRMSWLWHWGGGETDTAWLSRADEGPSDTTEKVDEEGYLYKFTNSAWRDAGSASVLFDTGSSGYFPSQGLSTKIIIAGTITAADGTVLKMSDPDDSAGNYDGRYHYDTSGSNYFGAYNLTDTRRSVDKVSDIPIPEPEAETQPAESDTNETVKPSSGKQVVAKLYRVADDTSYLYVAFSEPVTVSDDSKLVLAAYGWPVDWGLRYTVRDYFTGWSKADESGQIWKVAVTEGHWDWFLSADAATESPVAVDGNEGGYWLFGFVGTAKTSDGRTLPCELELLDGSVSVVFGKAYVLLEGEKVSAGRSAVGTPEIETAASVSEIVCPAAPATSDAFAVAVMIIAVAAAAFAVSKKR